jgi:hypothetical protein
MKLNNKKKNNKKEAKSMKKTLFIAMISLLVLITGCSVPPFNTKAKLEYDTTGFLTEIKPGDDVTVKVISKNGVGAELKKINVAILTSAGAVYYNYQIDGGSFDSKDIIPNGTTNFVLDLDSIISKMKSGFM